MSAFPWFHVFMCVSMSHTYRGHRKLDGHLSSDKVVYSTFSAMFSSKKEEKKEENGTQRLEKVSHIWTSNKIVCRVYIYEHNETKLNTAIIRSFIRIRRTHTHTHMYSMRLNEYSIERYTYNLISWISMYLILIQRRKWQTPNLEFSSAIVCHFAVHFFIVIGGGSTR